MDAIQLKANKAVRNSHLIRLTGVTVDTSIVSPTLQQRSEAADVASRIAPELQESCTASVGAGLQELCMKESTIERLGHLRSRSHRIVEASTSNSSNGSPATSTAGIVIKHCRKKLRMTNCNSSKEVSLRNNVLLNSNSFTSGP